MKKRAVKVLLPLLFSFCCVFSGFLSVNASASVVVDYYNILQIRGDIKDFGIYRDMYDNSGNYTGNGTRLFLESGVSLTSSSPNYYQFSNTSFDNVNEILFSFKETNVFNNINEFYNYYLIVNVYGKVSSVDYTFSPDNIFIRNNKTTGSSYINYSIDDVFVGKIASAGDIGFSAYGLLDFSEFSSIDSFILEDVSGGSLPEKVRLTAYILPIAKDTSNEQVQSIIAAINNQTTTLDGSIGQAADDIQQSIEDQYSGNPEDEFSVDDVITQHNEKMGVLSFGSDVMLQFLDMFQSANVGTAQLTLPGFNITVENVEYSVWPDYSFNFEQLNEWVPALMSVIRVMLPVFVWLMVLRYCIKVFEDNFLSK